MLVTPLSHTASGRRNVYFRAELLAFDRRKPRKHDNLLNRPPCNQRHAVLDEADKSFSCGPRVVGFAVAGHRLPNPILNDVPAAAA